MDKYDDIIDMGHYEPRGHRRMSMWNRAAQFAPFAALTGFEDSIKETAQENEKLFEGNFEANYEASFGDSPENS